MVSRLFGSNPLDDLIDRATSEYLPAGQMDLALTLDVCDMIRSKQVPAKQALQSLKRRISHRNPNVQLLALGVTDACVKNGGHHFLVEVASRDFMDFLLALSGTTTEVRNKILSLVQSWAASFKTRSDLGYVVEIYEQLRGEGYTFPPVEKMDPVMLDTSTPPDWSDSSVCTRCRTPFTFTNRKHHCRNCGHTFCGQCSSYFIPLPHLGIAQDVRVCTGCYLNLKRVTAPVHGVVNKAVQRVASSGYGVPPSPDSMQPSSSAAYAKKYADQEDEDLKRAIELSLKETQQQRSQGQQVQRYSKAPVVVEEVVEDDPDLAAAIAASLAEAEAQKQRQGSYNYRPSTPTTIKNHRPPEYDEELTTVEAENILLFATLVDKVRDNAYASATIANDYALRDLYNQIGALRPKLIKGLEDTARKHRAYVELHEKLNTAQQMYDAMVSDRMAANRMSQPFAGFNQPQIANHPYYPQPSSRPQTPFMGNFPQQQQQQQPQGFHAPPQPAVYVAPSAPPTYPPNAYGASESFPSAPVSVQPVYQPVAMGQGIAGYPSQQQPLQQQQPSASYPQQPASYPQQPSYGRQDSIPPSPMNAQPPQAIVPHPQYARMEQPAPQPLQQQTQLVRQDSVNMQANVYPSQPVQEMPPPPPPPQQHVDNMQYSQDPQHVIHMPTSPPVHQRNPFTNNPSIMTAVNGNYHPEQSLQQQQQQPYEVVRSPLDQVPPPQNFYPEHAPDASHDQITPVPYAPPPQQQQQQQQQQQSSTRMRSSTYAFDASRDFPTVPPHAPKAPMREPQQQPQPQPSLIDL